MIDTALFKQQLSELIATPSISCASPRLDTSNEGVIHLLANWLEHLGFCCDIMPVADHPGKSNLIATLGKGSGGLVLAGHSDTVPCNPELWHQDPFTLADKDQRFYGLGATDMKGFFPVVLAAVTALSDKLQRLQQPLIVLATADEETSMSGARALSLAGRPKARYAVIGEPTGMRPIRMHKGILMNAVHVQGEAGHSSNPALGKNALETMHQVMGALLKLRTQLQQRYQHAGFEVAVPTLNLGCIHGGDNPNRICNASELHFDLRPLPGMSLDALHREIEQTLRPIGDRVGMPITIRKLFAGVEAFEEAANSELTTVCEALTGHASDSVAFATEAPFFQAMGMQTIVMGPGSIDQAHQPNEYIDQRQIEPAVKTLVALIERCCF
ncbi:MAG: acetylornithine deacetylase [Cellvibrionaceae bacterium]|nr:acetylornithine deacetylase [Cellvibrionaceae bacterium]